MAEMVAIVVVLFGVQHFTHHWCIAFATIAGLYYVKPRTVIR